MPVAQKVAAFLEAITAADVAALEPARRRVFAALCRRAANLAESPDAPKSGVLADIRAGTPRHE